MEGAGAGVASCQHQFVPDQKIVKFSPGIDFLRVFVNSAYLTNDTPTTFLFQTLYLLRMLKEVNVTQKVAKLYGSVLKKYAMVVNSLNFKIVDFSAKTQQKVTF